MSRKAVYVVVLGLLVSLSITGCSSVSSEDIEEQIEKMIRSDYQVPHSDKEQKAESRIMKSEDFQTAAIEKIKDLNRRELAQFVRNLDLASYRNDEVKKAFQDVVAEWIPNVDSDGFAGQVRDYFYYTGLYHNDSDEELTDPFYYVDNGEVDSIICSYLEDETKDKWDVLRLANALKDYHESPELREKFEDYFDSNTIAEFKDVDEFIEYISKAKGFSSFYVDTITLFPYDIIDSFIKENGEVLSTKNDRGYYKENESTYDDSSSVIDPLEINEGKSSVGTYTASNNYDLLGDFMINNHFEKWYGTELSDDINSSSRFLYCRGKQIIDKESAVNKFENIIKSGGKAYYFGKENKDIKDADEWLIAAYGKDEIVFVLKDKIVFGVAYSDIRDVYNGVEEPFPSSANGESTEAVAETETEAEVETEAKAETEAELETEARMIEEPVDPEKAAYESAMGLLEEGKYGEAFYAFLEYPDYKDNLVKATDALSKSGTWIDIFGGYTMLIPEDWKEHSEKKKEGIHKTSWLSEDETMFLFLDIASGKNYTSTEGLVNVYSDEHPDATLVDLNGILVVDWIKENHILEVTWTDSEQKANYIISIGNNDPNSEMDDTEHAVYGLIMNTLQKK